MSKAKKWEKSRGKMRKIRHPEDLVKFLSENDFVYTGGRGKAVEAGYLVTGRVRRETSDAARGFVCNTLTTFYLAVVTNLDPGLFTPKAVFVSMFHLCEKKKRYVFEHPGLSRGVEIQPFGSHCELLEDVFTYEDLLQEEGDCFVVGESPINHRGVEVAPGYHHVATVTRARDGRLLRCGADGFRGKNGYSETPINVEVIEKGFDKKAGYGKPPRGRKGRRIKAYRVRSACSFPDVGIA